MKTPVDKEWVNSCLPKYFFFEGVQQQKSGQKNLDMLSLTRYYCHVLQISRLALLKQNCAWRGDISNHASRGLHD